MVHYLCSFSDSCDLRDPGESTRHLTLPLCPPTLDMREKSALFVHRCPVTVCAVFVHVHCVCALFVHRCPVTRRSLLGCRGQTRAGVETSGGMETGSQD